MDTLTIGGSRQLFLDDYVVAAVQNVQRKLHRPVRHPGNPILFADRPWEEQGTDLLGGSVMFDEEEGQFKMWYRTNGYHAFGAGGHTGRHPGFPGLYKALYATSADGIRWEKPALGQVEYGGSLDNNIISPGTAGLQWIRRPNVVKDPRDPDPNRRYKMLYIDDVTGNTGLLDHTTGKLALRKGYSADGIHWRMNVGQSTVFEPPISPHGVIFGWDPNIQKFVHYHIRRKALHADVDGRMARGERTIMRSTSPDFDEWGETAPAIWVGDEWLDPPNLNVGHCGVFVATLYHGLYIGFLDTMQTLDVADVPEELWDSYSAQDSEQKTELAISRDGLHWQRIQPHWAFFQPGLWGAWDREIVALCKPIVYNGEILFYYSGSNLPANSNTSQHPQFRYWAPGARVDGQPAGYSIGLAKLRLNGFASMDNYGPEVGSLTTCPLVFAGSSLVVNARAPREGQGRLQVEILDEAGNPLPGYGQADCDPFSGDETGHTVTWRGMRAVDRLAGRAIRLRFHLSHAALYAFQFIDR